MPEPFAQVVALKLVHGLDPVQIGRALRIPPTTVRTRLHRGLARLRGMLPAGMASAAALALPADALAAVRAAVLRAATEQAAVAAVGVASSSISTGVVMTKKAGWLLAVLVGLVALAVLPWLGAAAEDAGDSRPAPRVAVGAERPAPGAVRSDGVVGDAQRDVVADVAAEGWHVFGRITAEDGDGRQRPVDAALVELVVRRGDVRERPAEVRSDTDGWFRLPLAALGSYSALA